MAIDNTFVYVYYFDGSFDMVPQSEAWKYQYNADVYLIIKM